MKVTVTELRNDPSALKDDWRALIEHTKSENSDLVILPEMPFYPWVARTKHVDPDLWNKSVETHIEWIQRLSDLSSSIVVGTRPVTLFDNRYNEGFIWDSKKGYKSCHTKYYLPNEDGFWEASWYKRGDGDFSVIECGEINIGFLICTELWFNMQARRYANQNIHVLVCPRATPQKINK